MTFEAFVADCGARLLRLAYVLTGGDAAAAEDLAQTALVGVYRHWRRVSAARAPEAYARRMLLNAYLSGARRRSSTEVPVAEPEPGEVADPTDAVVDRTHVRAMLGRLAPRARAVLVLRYYADLPDAAIAAELGIAESTVRATASRALAALRAVQPAAGREGR